MSSVFLQYGDGSSWNAEAIITIAVLVMALVAVVHLAPALTKPFGVADNQRYGQGRAFRQGILASMGNLAAVLLLSLFGFS